MTPYFIISIFIFIIIYDVFLLIKKGGTITSVIKRWYKTFIFVPFTVGVLFLGHFMNFIEINKGAWWTICGLGGAGTTVLIISIILSKKNKSMPKWLIPIIILFGYLVGDIWF